MHAALDFTFEHPAVAAHWHEVSNTIVFLAARDELALSWLAEDAAAAGIEHTTFREPDLDDALTAVAVGPSGARLVRKLPLALGDRNRIEAAIVIASKGSCVAAPVLTNNTPGGAS